MLKLSNNQKNNQMKKVHLICLLCFCLYHANGQNSNDIVIGKIDSIDSKILKEQRKVWIHVPDSGVSGVSKKKKYPVVYLLDGDNHFHSVVGMIRQLSSINGNTICPKMIVVGIPNTNRTRDLTPTKGKHGHPFVDSTMVADSGGGDQFISFIEKELIPYIDATYPTEPYRMFIGHSLGGLLVMHTLVNQPELFNAYVAIDPSMWWGDQKLLHKIKHMAFDEKFSRKSLYLGIANTVSEGMDTVSVKKDTTFETEHIRALLALHTSLHNNAKKQLSYRGKFYADDNHGSVPLITEYDALRFIFDFYPLKFEPADYLNPDRDFVGKVEQHYERLSKEFGRTVKPDEEYINGLGYHFMHTKQFDKAEGFFKLNVANYPDSFIVYDCLGDFYRTIGNRERAIENYRKSIVIDGASPAKGKLEELLRQGRE